MVQAYSLMMILRSKHVGVPLNIFMYFSIEINILDEYSVECEKVHMLVFINYYIKTYCCLSQSL